MTKMLATETFPLLLSVFPGLSGEQLNALSEAATLDSFKAGDVLLAEGEPPHSLFVIVSGSVDVFKKTSSDCEGFGVKLISLRRGEVAGESVFSGMPLNATVVAANSETTALRIDSKSLTGVLESSPSLAASVIKGLSAELRTFRAALSRKSGVFESKRVVRMAVFDFMKHEKASFEAAVEAFKQTLDKSIQFEVVYHESKLSTKTVRLASDCEVVCIFVNDCANAEILTLLHAQGTKLLTLRCAGFDMVDLKAAAALGISVTRVPAYSPYAVAEFAVALLTALVRKIVPASSRVRQGNFSLAGLVGFDFHGKTVGVIGTGKIGQCFIKIMLGFGCKVLCYDPYPSKEVAAWENCLYVTLDELYASSRVISLHVPLLPDTAHMINSKSLSKMVKGVVLINTSRGGLVDTQALISALKSGQVSGAGLDVYENEKPLFFEDHSLTILEDDSYARLCSFQNVLVTGHQAFLTEEALEKIGEVTMLNVRQSIIEGQSGERLENHIC